MELKILCTQWGHDHMPIEDFFIKVKEAGYDGVDTWLPEKKEERSRFIRLLKEYDLAIVSHQHQAKGNNIGEYCQSLEYYLSLSLECEPLLINSHSGRDYFTLGQQLRVLDIAEKFADENNITIAHETHRGRIGFSPGNAAELFAQRPQMKITGDFSHWVCVTGSYLEDFSEILTDAVNRTEHTHARVGFTEGPQVSDPAAPQWAEQLRFFTELWQRIYDRKKISGAELFTITPEFGPPPYMWTNIEDGMPVASQWDINIFIKDLLREQFAGQKNQRIK